MIHWLGTIFFLKLHVDHCPKGWAGLPLPLPVSPSWEAAGLSLQEPAAASLHACASQLIDWHMHRGRGLLQEGKTACCLWACTNLNWVVHVQSKSRVSGLWGGAKGLETQTLGLGLGTRAWRLHSNLGLGPEGLPKYLLKSAFYWSSNSEGKTFLLNFSTWPTEGAWLL